MLQLTDQRFGSKTVCGFLILKGICFKLKESMHFVEKIYINFNKNESESKMGNPTHSFRQMNLVLQLIYESKIKSKNVMSWSL